MYSVEIELLMSPLTISCLMTVQCGNMKGKHYQRTVMEPGILINYIRSYTNKMEILELFDKFDENKDSLRSKSELLPLFQSRFQLENFCLIKDAVDEFGLFRKCNNEITSRMNNMEKFYFSYKNLRIDIDEAKFKGETKVDEFERRRWNIVLEEKTLSLRNLEVAVRNVLEELEILRTPFEALYNKFKDEDINKLEANYWVRKYRKDMEHLIKFNKIEELDVMVSEFGKNFLADVIKGLPSNMIEKTEATEGEDSDA